MNPLATQVIEIDGKKNKQAKKKTTIFNEVRPIFLPTSSESLHFHYEKIYKYKNISLKFIPNPSPCIRKDTPCTPFLNLEKYFTPRAIHTLVHNSLCLYSQGPLELQQHKLFSYTQRSLSCCSLFLTLHSLRVSFAYMQHTYIYS